MSWYSSNILQSECNLSWFGSQLAWDFAKVPVELSQITDEFIETMIGLIRVIVLSWKVNVKKNLNLSLCTDNIFIQNQMPS